MIRYTHFIFIIIIFLITSCTSSIDGAWVKSEEDGTRMWLSNADPTLRYQWKGETFDSVAHGNGVLRIIYNDSIIEERKAKAYYGALTDAYIVGVAEKENYVGELNDDKFCGYGVYDKNGEIYIGNFKDSKPHGYASWYKDGKPYYIGMWADGKFHGEGTLYKEDGTIKSGEWSNGNLTQTLVDVQIDNGHYNGYVKNNKPDGIGKMEYADGSVYSGKWKDGLWNGSGTYKINDSITIASIWTSGVIDGQTVISTPILSYEGGYLEGYPTGLCKIEMPNLYNYYGYMRDGVRSGYGELILNTGDSYEGDWYDNMFDGDGVYVYSKANAKYDGQWYQGLQDGIGHYQCPEFAYRGEWEEGWINGYGKMTFSNKDQYIGGFVENQFYGDGSYFFSNGNQYAGEFVEGKFNGLGTFYFSNGDVYTGEFKDGEILGDGTLKINEDGQQIIITANWPGNNKFPAQGSILFPNGDIYEGELMEGVPTKNGKWTSLSEISNNQSWADNAADYYNNHIEEIQKIRTALKYAAFGLGAVALVATVVVTGGAAAPAVIALNSAATIVTVTSTVAEAGSAATEAYDDYRNTDDESEKSSIRNNAIKNITIDAGLSLLTKGKIKSPKRISKVLLSGCVKTIGKTTQVNISNKKFFGKIVTIAKNNGIYEKKLITTNNQNLKNLKSKITPKSVTNVSVTGVKLYRSLQKQKEVQSIALSEDEFKLLVQNPKIIRAYIKKYTGNHHYFEEFFIRLALGNKSQVKELFNIPYICKFVDRSIRLSGNNDTNRFLMGQTFGNFLTDPKYGEDGQVLALLQIQLIRKLNSTVLNGENKRTTSLSQINSELDRLNDYLATELSSCLDKDEVLSKFRTLAKNKLSSVEYEKFDQILKSIK